MVSTTLSPTSADQPYLQGLSGLPLAIFITVALLTACFIVGYAWKGGQVGAQLWRAVKRLRALAAASRGAADVDPNVVARVLAAEPLRHLWVEYADTLHELSEPPLLDEHGEPGGAAGEAGYDQHGAPLPANTAAAARRRVRATMPAEAFFTRDALVDSRLFDDFTRHLPGVLTGLGIIGTFAGLLDGLSHFDAGSSATAIAGLKPLLQGVAHAFSASALAIACAMFVTFTSRFCLAMFYRWVEQLNRTIDGLYATGAGEEYLSRLVQSSERAEGHAAELRQTLVDELSKMMTQLVDRQVKAQVDSSRQMGMQIADRISVSLSAPIERLVQAVEATQRHDVKQVAEMIDGMLSRFTSRLDDTMGGQARAMQQQMDVSMTSMSVVQQSLQSLVGNIERANRQVTTHLTESVHEAMQQSAANQDQMAEQMRAFTRELRGASQEQQQRTEQALESLIESISLQIQHTQRNVDAIGAISTQAIDGMKSGAASIEAAAQRFVQAGDTVSGVLDRSAQLGAQLNATADVLQSSSQALREGFGHYEQTRQTVDASVASLTTLIASVRNEAGLSKTLMADLQRIVEQLKLAEAQSEHYLEGVNRTLSRSFEEFGSALTNQLRNTIGDTDRHLSSGVQQLNGVVQHIGLALARMKRH